MKQKGKIAIILILIIVFFGAGTLIKNNGDNDTVAAFANEHVNKKRSDIPILMYHSIATEKGNGLRVPPEVFKEQMEYLKENNYYPITLDELYGDMENGKKVRDGAVVITFDDGYEDNYKNAYPILKQNGFHATIFVITDFVDKGNIFLKSNELREMDKNGIDIESHTVKHENLPLLSYKNQLKTLTDSKKYLENILSKKVNYIAYPFGQYDNSTIKAVKQAGYKMALTTAGRWAGRKDGIYKLNRIYVNSFFDMATFKERLNNPDYMR